MNFRAVISEVSHSWYDVILTFFLKVDTWPHSSRKHLYSSAFSLTLRSLFFLFYSLFVTSLCMSSVLSGWCIFLEKYAEVLQLNRKEGGKKVFLATSLLPSHVSPSVLISVHGYMWCSTNGMPGPMKVTGWVNKHAAAPYVSLAPSWVNVSNVALLLSIISEETVKLPDVHVHEVHVQVENQVFPSKRWA